MKPVAVLVPIYKTGINDYERISLEQCLNVLASHPIYLVKPAGLDVTEITSRYPALRVKAFADQYFQNIAGYNRLLCSEFFYEAFLEYDYILISQLDAFIFKDSLLDWCQRGFDYIGAPQFGDISFKNNRRQTWREFLSAYFQRPLLNGGLSLRRVKACLRLLHYYYATGLRWPGNEDGFFSLHAPRLMPFRGLMKHPSALQALSFAMELEPALSMEANGGQLPMGCHAWFLYDLDYWRPYIRRFGYNV